MDSQRSAAVLADDHLEAPPAYSASGPPPPFAAAEAPGGLLYLPKTIRLRFRKLILIAWTVGLPAHIAGLICGLFSEALGLVILFIISLAISSLLGTFSLRQMHTGIMILVSHAISFLSAVVSMVLFQLVAARYSTGVKGYLLTPAIVLAAVSLGFDLATVSLSTLAYRKVEAVAAAKSRAKRTRKQRASIPLAAMNSTGGATGTDPASEAPRPYAGTPSSLVKDDEDEDDVDVDLAAAPRMVVGGALVAVVMRRVEERPEESSPASAAGAAASSVDALIADSSLAATAGSTAAAPSEGEEARPRVRPTLVLSMPTAQDRRSFVFSPPSPRRSPVSSPQLARRSLVLPPSPNDEPRVITQHDYESLPAYSAR